MTFFKNRRAGVFLLMMCLVIVSCEAKKEGKVVVTNQEFSIRQDSEYAYVIDAKGSVKNTGDVAVKKIVVTGNCRTCGEAMVAGQWMISPDVEKTPEQIDAVSYLNPGEEEGFSFRGIAFMYNKVPKAPKNLPDGLEIEILGFETVGR